jgi:hypothetical protein
MKKIITFFVLFVFGLGIWGSIQIFWSSVPSDIKELVQTEETTVLIDFRLPSYQKRLWVFKNKKVIFSARVSHGKKSGETYAENFSNEPHSNMSSLGKYRTSKNSYIGKHGKSLKIYGLDPTNDNAFQRGIVFHGADYAKLSFIFRLGRLGRSEGCFATDPEDNLKLIELIKGGKLIHVIGD